MVCAPKQLGALHLSGLGVQTQTSLSSRAPCYICVTQCNKWKQLLPSSAFIQRAIPFFFAVTQRHVTHHAVCVDEGLGKRTVKETVVQTEARWVALVPGLGLGELLAERGDEPFVVVERNDQDQRDDAVDHRLHFCNNKTNAVDDL